MPRLIAACSLLVALTALPVAAQTPALDQPSPAPAPQVQAAAAQPSRLPPAGSPALYRTLEIRFHPINESLIEPQTYLYYIQTQPSRPSDGVWVPFTETTEQSLLDDFKRLWATNFLDNLWIEVEDQPWDNGVTGKRVIVNLEERPRIKIVDYTGSAKIERTKIDEKMREANIALRLDSFLDESAVRRTETLLRDMQAEKGYEAAEVTHTYESLPGGPKLVKVVFNVDQGPKVRIRNIDFIGNTEIGDGSLQRRMKSTKESWFLSWITGRGTYQEAKFEEDADNVVAYYRDRGYIESRVGQPEVRTLEDSPDKETRWIELRIPVTEGPRYKVGEVTFDGNTIIKTDYLRTLYKAKAGDWYSEKRMRDFFTKAREAYGVGGYFEFTGFPDLQPQAAAEGPVAGPAEPTVKVNLKLTEGEQYFVNRITFTGNSTTRDNVIRREMRLAEGAPFNTEALKYSVRRLNQLGYFQNLEEQGAKGINVEKTAGSKNEVDVTLKLEEQNRNQLTFGAGVSQYEGFFGQLSFQTSNFLGRGESLTLSLQSGSRAQNYQVAFSEPFLFDRNITGAVDVYRRSIQYIGQFTQQSTGGNILFGFPVADFSRFFATYSYEQVRVTDFNDFFYAYAAVDQARNPFLQDSLFLGQNGTRTVSKVVPSFVFNTVDNPIFPNTGRRLTMSSDFAGIGGNTNFVKPRIEAIGFFRHTGRTTLGLRGQAEYIRAYGSTVELPIFERLFQGGEYSVRGYDIRSIGPRDPETQLVLGGNKSLLFNAEYMVQIAGPVRLIFFYDAGQVRARGVGFGFKENITQIVTPPGLSPVPGTVTLRDPNAGPAALEVIGERSAFKTSTGAEVRFFMPVLNVPFRLIFAMNPQNDGVLNNSLQPSKRFTFRFAVGSTF